MSSDLQRKADNVVSTWFQRECQEDRRPTLFSLGALVGDIVTAFGGNQAVRQLPAPEVIPAPATRTRQPPRRSGPKLNELTRKAPGPKTGGKCGWDDCDKPMRKSRAPYCLTHWRLAQNGPRSVTPRPPAADDSADKMAFDNPTELELKGDAASVHQRADCPAFNRCQLLAKRKGWNSHSCGNCEGTKRFSKEAS